MSGAMGFGSTRDSRYAQRRSLSPSDFTTFLLLSIGECVLEAGRGMWGEFLCATAADISFDDEIGGRLRECVLRVLRR